MPVKKTILYTADDGKSYANYDDAMNAQREHTKRESKRRAYRKHVDGLSAIFRACGSTNDTMNQNAAMEIMNKPAFAKSVRDHLNRVLEYQRRTAKV